MSQQANLKEFCIFALSRTRKQFSRSPTARLSGSRVRVLVLQVNRFEQVGGTGPRARDGVGKGCIPIQQV